MAELIPLIVGILLAQVMPGPNAVAVLSASVGSGRRAGIATAAGVASGVLVWSILFTFGIGAFIDAFPKTVTVLRFAGGGYLVFLGLRALLAALRGQQQRAPGAGRQTTPARAYRTGVTVVLSNPKAALMWVAVSVFLAAANYTSVQFLIVGVCASLSAMAVYGGYAWVFSTGAVTRTYRAMFRAIEATFGAVFGLVGARLISDGIKELRA